MKKNYKVLVNAHLVYQQAVYTVISEMLKLCAWI